MDWLSFFIGMFGVAVTWYFGRRTIRKVKERVPPEYWPDDLLARSNITMIKRKYFIERKYLNAAIFFAAIGVITAGVFLMPTDTPKTVDRLEQCQRAMRGPDTDRMAREKKHCIEEFQQLVGIGDPAPQ